MTLGPDDFLARFEVERAALRALLADGRLDAAVPSCGTWTLADLGSHLGGIYRFAATALIENRGSAEELGPTERAALLEWFDSGADLVHSALAARDWQRATWTMAPPATVGFWARRMCHETTLHRWDAERSQGQSPSIDDELALDGIDEVVTMFFPRQIRLGRIAPLTGSLRIEASAAGTAHTFVLAGDGSAPVETQPGPDPGSHATLAGPALDILLALWKRTDLDNDSLQLRGDLNAARRILDQALTP